MAPSVDRLASLAGRLRLSRPLCVLDLESTGLDVHEDRIVEIAAWIVHPDGSVERLRSLVNPEREVPACSQAIHGLGDEELLGAPRFRDIAESLARRLRPCDYAGFNVLDYDLPLLAEEFRRAGVDYDPTKARVVDAMTIFRRHERRDLSAAVRLYCGRRHEGHRAEADVSAVVDVLAAQLERYPQLPRELDSLDRFCRSPHGDR